MKELSFSKNIMKEKKRHKFKLDEVNLHIFNSLSETGKVNYSKIGKEHNLSHVSIKNRYERLINRETIKPAVLFNFSQYNYKLGVLLLEIDGKAIQKIQNIYKNCPRLICLFSVVGEYNYLLIFFAENLSTLETLVNSCMLYNLEGVRKSTVMLLSENLDNNFLPIRWSLFQNIAEDSPCGTSCEYCKAFIQERCLACPVSTHYRGPLKLQK